MKKCSKRYIVSDESKNMDGYRVLTSGIQIDAYNKNPLLLWMHERPKGKSREEILPVGNGVALLFEGNKLTCGLSLDDTDDFALTLYRKLENGTLRALSAGLIPLEWKKIGDELWLVRSVLKEISIVDMGSNAEAVGIALYDTSDNLITLSLKDIENQLKPEIKMKMIQLKASDLAAKLGLKEDAPETEFATAINGLVTLAATQKNTIETLEGEKKTAEDKATEFETKYQDEIKLKMEAKINTLVDAAFNAKKITADQKEGWVKLANKDFEGTKAVLDGMPTNPDVMGIIKKPSTEDKMQNLTWKELDKQGMLVKLKADNFELFKAKYKEEFDRDWQEK